MTNGSKPQQPRWHTLADEPAVQRAALEFILASAARAIAERGEFHLVLSGGNTPRGVYALLSQARTDWKAWHVYFGDERCLAPDDPARNSHMAGEAWLNHVAIPPEQRHLISGELGAAVAALHYAQTLHGVGDFDLVLLGLGEDGHTASLFADHDWGAHPGAPDTLAIKDAPKPPPERVSLSAARLSRARNVLFLVCGASKQQALAQWRCGRNIPAAAIRPAGGVDVLLSPALPALDQKPEQTERMAPR